MDREFSDIDVVGLSRESARLRRAVAELGYAENRHVSEATGGAQLQYLRPASPLESHAHMTKRPRPGGLRNEAHSAADHLDVFLDAMRMDHDVDLRYRLDIDPYAISPADILLTKLQIGRAAEKDVHDIVALLKDVPLGETDDGACIDARRLAVACAADWGLWFDITGNLRVVAALIADYELDDNDAHPRRRASAGRAGNDHKAGEVAALSAASAARHPAAVAPRGRGARGLGGHRPAHRGLSERQTPERRNAGRPLSRPPGRGCQHPAFARAGVGAGRPPTC